MKNKKRARVILFFLFGLLISAAPVAKAAEGYQETVPPPEVTITSPVIIIAATSTEWAEPDNFNCPEDGIIDGWGLVTPSTYWEYACSECLITPLPPTSTAPPVATWDGTGTPPPPTMTATPDLSATATPTQFISPFTFTTSGDITFTTAWAATLSQSFTKSFDSYTRSISGNASLVTTSSYDSYFQLNYSFGLSPCPTTSNPATIYYHNNMVCEGCSGTWGYMGGSREVTTCSLSVSSRWLVPKGSTATLSGDFAISLDPFNPYSPTPTPTPLPSDGSFCATVDPHTDSFSYSGIIFGDIACLDLFDYSLSILGLEISIPYFAHICFQDVQVGVVTLFGVSFPLDPFLYAAGIAWFVRNMFIS